ncbi:MAG: hemolysin family protein [Bacteroidaceae bacterium]|nr:hemolysin family protein [Bacteroidaceae bacterium]
MSTLIATLIVLLFSAFFSGMEIAFVSSSKLRAEMDRAEGDWTSRLLGVFYAHPNHFISTLLVGNNIALVIYGILMARIIDTLLIDPFIHSHALALTLETVISTLIVLVFGEFLPKALFRISPNATLRAFALPTMLVYILLYPISKFTSTLSKGLLRLAGIKVSNNKQQSFKKADLDHLIQSNIDETGAEGEISEDIKIFQNALEFSSVRIRDCMVPRTEVDALPLTSPLDQLLNLFVESGHSKILVYDSDIDDVAGYVHSSDIFHLDPRDAWQKRVRTLTFVPETMSAQKLMQDFLQHKRSLAVVVDEFGGTSGIVTLEDLVEEIFGEIRDEHDKEEYVCSEVAPGEYLLSGRLEIEQANERLNLDLPESEDYKTVGGLILHEYQSFPKLNEKVMFGHFEFKILKMTTTKIELVRLKILR